MNIAKMLVVPEEMINLYTRKGTLLYINIYFKRETEICSQEEEDG